MTITDKMDEYFESSISQLSEKEQMFVRHLKLSISSIYTTYLKPILIAVFMFWLFTKIKNAVGLQEAMYVQLIVIIIFLRSISSKIKG